MRKWAILVLLACWLTPPSAQAHEIGTSNVRLTVAGARWTAEITTAPTALLNKLEAESGLPLSRDLTDFTLRGKLQPLLERLAKHIDVRFDGAPSVASVEIAQIAMPSDVTQPSYIVLRAGGSAPENARGMTWRYGLIYSTYAIVFTGAQESGPETQWLDGDATSKPFALADAGPPPTRLQIMRQYLELGFSHIVPEGLDHILFVLGLFFLSSRFKPLLVQVTCFTVAHSVTLGLTMVGVLSISPRIVEPLIALSIAYVAIENIVTPKLTPWRPAIVFAFGLVHGMGFAGALGELNLPRAEIIPALVSFNVGIELAQLFVIATAYFALAFWAGDKGWYRARIVMPACLAIAATGLFWTFQRVFESYFA